ncbi:hypothetical protein, partial [Fibrobacter succinogenes]|uniref:hypothetical protein n=1 Tax=Fibrobacter succinogenes TaxID=833 RepID=UPI001966D152
QLILAFQFKNLNKNINEFYFFLSTLTPSKRYKKHLKRHPYCFQVEGKYFSISALLALKPAQYMLFGRKGTNIFLSGQTFL